MMREIFESLFRKLSNLNLKTSLKLQTKLRKTVDERQIRKEKNIFFHEF